MEIRPQPIAPGIDIVKLVDEGFVAFNGGRLREICWLLREVLRNPRTAVGWSLAGALTPLGYGISMFAPLMRAGFIDYIVSTGANLYHDMHYSLQYSFEVEYPGKDDLTLRQEERIRIYDVTFDAEALLQTDQYSYRLMKNPEFKGRMGTAELHYKMGRYVLETERRHGLPHHGLMATAHELGVPLYTPAPSDGTIGLNLGALRLLDPDLQIDVVHDLNEFTAMAYETRQAGAESAVVILGGGVPKNYMLQPGPQIQEVLKLKYEGHDYFVQITDARQDTGGLSGATPAEAFTWGKVTEKSLNRNIVCYVDSTIALPIITAYLLATCQPRPLKRLYDQRLERLARFTEVYRKETAKRADLP